MERSTILHKLATQFSISTVEIPKSVNIKGQRFNLKERIASIVKATEDGELKKVMAEVIELEKGLGELFNGFVGKVEKSEIGPQEAESQLSYYLGIKRAIVILKGISEGSLNRFKEDNERKSTAEDRERWFKTTKKLAES